MLHNFFLFLQRKPFGYTRKDVLLIGVGVTVIGVGLKTGLEVPGFLFVVILTFCYPWILNVCFFLFFFSFFLFFYRLFLFIFHTCLWEIELNIVRYILTAPDKTLTENKKNFKKIKKKKKTVSNWCQKNHFSMYIKECKRSITFFSWLCLPRFFFYFLFLYIELDGFSYIYHAWRFFIGSPAL